MPGAPVQPQLHPGERSIITNGVHLLTWDRPGAGNEPLFVFLPGAIHLARIAYGHPGAEPKDFLAHWLGAAGCPFTAVSYPLQVADPAFAEVDPNLGLASFVGAVADHVASLVADWQLTPEVVVLGWSAAGNAAPGLSRALADRGLDLSLFVSLAATPPLPDLIFGSLDASRAWARADTSFTDAGLLAHAGLRSFASELEQTDLRYGRTVLSAAAYHRHYLGNMPLNLFPGLGVRTEGGRLVAGHDGPLAESQGSEWASYPLVASLQPTWRLDERHAVTDRHNWGLVNANALQARFLAGSDLDSLSDRQWEQVRTAFDGVSSDLHRVVEGGHMFFVGEDGARETVQLAQELRERAKGLTEFLRSIFEHA